MTKTEWVGFLKRKNIDIDKYDIKLRKSRYGNEAWFYRKSDTGYPKEKATGNIFIDGVLYKYKSNEYFERCKLPYKEIKREYKIVYQRMGNVIVEADLLEMTDDDIKYSFC